MSLTGTYIKPNVKLFDNQKENVRQLVCRRHALLSDKVGAGKSLSTLYAFACLKQKEKVKNLIVLTPLSAYAKKVWYIDITKFTTFKSIDLDTLSARLEGHYDKIDMILNQYDVIYGKHSHVKQYSNVISTICARTSTLLVVDEVHAFKNPNSDLTIKFKASTLGIKNFWGITGTSVSKNLEDVYNIVNLIYPWFFGTFLHFRDNYCLTKEKVIGRRGGRLVKAQEIIGVKDEEAFKQKISAIMIAGQSFLKVKYQYVDYELTEEEAELYRTIANGIDLSEELTAEAWLKKVLSEDTVEPRPIKEVERHSSRFIYLQSSADGILTRQGTQDNNKSTKIDLLIDRLRTIVDKKQSVIVYFDFKASLECVYRRIVEEKLDVVLLRSTGDHVLKNDAITEAKVKQKPHILLCTKAASESVSYYFMNNVIFFHVPTIPSCMVQLLGRITRKNTLYPDDLNCYIFRSTNIDLYKLMVVSAKAAQMEAAQMGYTEENIPPDYKRIATKAEALDRAKKVLLWRRY